MHISKSRNLTLDQDSHWATSTVFSCRPILIGPSKSERSIRRFQSRPERCLPQPGDSSPLPYPASQPHPIGGARPSGSCGSIPEGDHDS